MHALEANSKHFLKAKVTLPTNLSLYIVSNKIHKKKLKN